MLQVPSISSIRTKMKAAQLSGDSETYSKLKVDIHYYSGYRDCLKGSDRPHPAANHAYTQGWIAAKQNLEVGIVHNYTDSEN